jgi:hypothetical protein
MQAHPPPRLQADDLSPDDPLVNKDLVFRRVLIDHRPYFGFDGLNAHKGRDRSSPMPHVVHTADQVVPSRSPVSVPSILPPQ